MPYRARREVIVAPASGGWVISWFDEGTDDNHAQRKGRNDQQVPSNEVFQPNDQLEYSVDDSAQERPNDAQHDDRQEVCGNAQYAHYHEREWHECNCNQGGEIFSANAGGKEQADRQQDANCFERS